jgi:hypothetical protein
MSIQRMHRGLIFVLGTGLGLAIGVAGTVGRGQMLSRPCAWPAELDATVAAPANHTVLLENDRVRVLDVTVAPGERQAVHAHCWPSVMYQTYVGIAKDYDAQGRLVDEQITAPPDTQFPMTMWVEPTPPHALHNLDTKPVRLLRIELKR